jgi:hypothetical protein
MKVIDTVTELHAAMISRQIRRHLCGFSKDAQHNTLLNDGVQSICCCYSKPGNFFDEEKLLIFRNVYIPYAFASNLNSWLERRHDGRQTREPTGGDIVSLPHPAPAVQRCFCTCPQTQQGCDSPAPHPVIDKVSSSSSGSYHREVHIDAADHRRRASHLQRES